MSRWRARRTPTLRHHRIQLLAMRITPWFVVLVMTLIPAAARAGEGDASLNTFFKSYLEDELKHRPLMATQLGDHRYEDQMVDLSAAARAKRVAQARTTLDEMHMT